MNEFIALTIILILKNSHKKIRMHELIIRSALLILFTKSIKKSFNIKS